MSNEKITRTIAALLAKAESTNHEKERDAFLAKAQELQIKYVVEDSAIRERMGQKKEEIISRKFCEERHGSFIKAKRELINYLARMNRCMAVIGAKRSYVEITGYESDVDFVSVMYTSLLLQMQSAMARDEVFRSAGDPVKTWRTSYAHAWVRRVAARLQDALKASESDAEVSTPGTAIVLRDRRQEVSVAVSARYGKLRQGYKNTATSSYSGYAAGDAAGRRANLNNRGSVGMSSSRELPA